MSQTPSPLDKPNVSDHIKRWIAEGETNTGILLKLSETFGIKSSEKSVRRFRKRHGETPLHAPGYTNVQGDVAEASTGTEKERPRLDDPDTMLRDRGLSPNDWLIENIGGTDWEGNAGNGEKITFYRTKFNAVRKNSSLPIVAPRTDGWEAPPKLREKQSAGLYVIVGDQQAPFFDPGLHESFCSWLEDIQPDNGVLLGDTLDFPDISRHPKDPENNARVNECLQSGYDMLRGYVDASPETYWDLLEGNHDERLRNIILASKKAAPLYGIKRADTPEENGVEVLTLDHLLRLDELGINHIKPHGSYKLSQYNINDQLAVRHGWLARTGSGSSALATLDALGYTVVVGHTHRQSLVSMTKPLINGMTKTIYAAEAGCMCRVSQIPGEDGRIWPSYTPAPDWSQGFATVEVWEDGSFNIDLAKYSNGSLFWRGLRY